MRVFRKWAAPAVFARLSYNLKEAPIKYLKAICFSVKTMLIVGGYRLPPTGYKNNLQNNVNILILEFSIFFNHIFVSIWADNLYHTFLYIFFRTNLFGVC